MEPSISQWFVAFSSKPRPHVCKDERPDGRCGLLWRDDGEKPDLQRGQRGCDRERVLECVSRIGKTSSVHTQFVLTTKLHSEPASAPALHPSAYRCVCV